MSTPRFLAGVLILTIALASMGCQVMSYMPWHSGAPGLPAQSE